MADAALAARIKAALASVEIPGGADLAGYGGLSDIIVLAGSPWSVFAGNVLWAAPSGAASSSQPEDASFDWRMAA